MSNFNQLGFYTADDIFNFAKEKGNDSQLNKTVEALRNKDKIIVIRYSESSQEQTENYTPEFSMEIQTKVFALVEGNIYTDSKEYLHMIKAQLSGQSLEIYLTTVVAQIEESHRIAKEQEKELDVNENRIIVE